MWLAQGHADVFVAEDMLQGLQVRLIHDQVTGEGVTEVMEPEIFDPRLATSCLDGRFHLILG
jgi:hypothetical protein